MNGRADVLAALLAASDRGVSLADVAQATRFSKQNVASAVDALDLAGLVNIKRRGNEQRVAVAASFEFLPGLRWPVAQPDWVARFGVSLAALRFERRIGMSPTVRAIEARRSVEPLLARILDAGMPVPDLGILGEAFSSAYDAWVGELVEELGVANAT